MGVTERSRCRGGGRRPAPPPGSPAAVGPTSLRDLLTGLRAVLPGYGLGATGYGVGATGCAGLSGSSLAQRLSRRGRATEAKAHAGRIPHAAGIRPVRQTPRQVCGVAA